MQITKTFDLPYALDLVWHALSDVRLVASCLPGAAVQEELGDDRFKGSFSVKVGPLAAAFGGEVGIQRDADHYTATVTGKGADPRSSSRASGSMTYRLVRVDDTTTRVEVDSTLNLAGALAQFGKAGVVQQIANRITATFVQNLQARLAEMQPAMDAAPANATAMQQASHAAQTNAPAMQAAPGEAQSHATENAGATPRREQPQAPLDAGHLLWSLLRDTILAWLRRLFGSSAQI